MAVTGDVAGGDAVAKAAEDCKQKEQRRGDASPSPPSLAALKVSAQSVWMGISPDYVPLNRPTRSDRSNQLAVDRKGGPTRSLFTVKPSFPHPSRSFSMTVSTRPWSRFYAAPVPDKLPINATVVQFLWWRTLKLTSLCVVIGAHVSRSEPVMKTRILSVYTKHGKYNHPQTSLPLLTGRVRMIPFGNIKI